MSGYYDKAVCKASEARSGDKIIRNSVIMVLS